MTDEMHRRVSWMAPADTAILRLLDLTRPDGSPILMRPAAIAENTGYTRSHIGRRLRFLREWDLVHRNEESYYNITETGEMWIHGNLPAENLEPEEEKDEDGADD